MTMLLGPTKNAGVKRDDAKAEDEQRGEEALQSERSREDLAQPTSPDYASGSPGEEPGEAETRAAERAGRA